jgi:diadenosine tetraphosphate (Ap4A) HIT family hydrolase
MTSTHHNTEMDCPFCNLPPSRVLYSNAQAIVVRDAYPVSEGHTLILARRHVGSFFELGDTERASMLELLKTSQTELDARYSPAGYNIGINDGAAAGQTVPHVHMHLIPRRTNDVDDPRGGVRWVIPDKARYWL